MTRHLSSPESPLRARLAERLTYLDDLVQGGLDDCFSPNDDPDVRRACRERLQQYITQVQLFLPSLADGVTPQVDRVLMDVPVTVVDEEIGDREVFTVVGPDEVDAAAGLISFLSPLGSALLLKRVGETVVLEAPGGRFQYRIAAIGDSGGRLNPSATAAEPQPPR